MTEQGTVVRRIDDAHVLVEVGRRSACDHCQVRGACKPTSPGGASLLTAQDTIGVNVGDEVVVSIDDSALLKAVWWVYVLPLILLVLAGSTTFFLLGSSEYDSIRDMTAAFSALVGAGIGLGLLRLIQSRLTSPDGTRRGPWRIAVTARVTPV